MEVVEMEGDVTEMMEMEDERGDRWGMNAMAKGIRNVNRETAKEDDKSRQI